MSRIGRIGNVALGLLMLACGVLLLLAPSRGIVLVAFVLGIALIVYGARKLVFYLTMARYMAGGFTILFVGIIAIDMGAFALALIDKPFISLVIYLVAYNGFAALVSFVRSTEHRRLGGRWVPSMLHAVVNALLVIACLALFWWEDALIVIFCIGLLYSAVMRIASAFKQTDVIHVA